MRFNFPGVEPWELTMEQSCSLLSAELGEHTLDEIARVEDMTKERARQVIEIAFDKFRKNGEGLE